MNLNTQSAPAPKIVVLALLSIAGVLWASLTTAVCASEPRYDFKLEEITTGKSVSMADLPGKPLIVYIWAPDCPHCQRQMPYVVNLYNRIDHDQVNFVTCSMAPDKQATLDYIKLKRLRFPVLRYRKGGITESFTEKGWPTTFLFSADGKISHVCDAKGREYVDELKGLADESVAATQALPSQPPSDAPAEHANQTSRSGS